MYLHFCLSSSSSTSTLHLLLAPLLRPSPLIRHISFSSPRFLSYPPLLLFFSFLHLLLFWFPSSYRFLVSTPLIVSSFPLFPSPPPPPPLFSSSSISSSCPSSPCPVLLFHLSPLSSIFFCLLSYLLRLSITSFLFLFLFFPPLSYHFLFFFSSSHLCLVSTPLPLLQ